MKKFLLLALFAVLGMAQAVYAQVSIQCDGKEVNEGDVLRFYPHEDEFGDMISGPEVDPTIFPNKKESNVSVKISIPAKAAGKFTWCGLTGECQAGLSGGEHTRSTIVKGFEYEGQFLASTNMQLHLPIVEGQTGMYSVKTEVSVDGKLERTFYMVYYEDVQAGIDGVEAQSESVKFADNVCHYNFSVEAPRTLNVYGVDGKLAYQSVLSAAQGSVSLNGLQKGAYVYSVVENGKKANSGKLLVK